MSLEEILELLSAGKQTPGGSHACDEDWQLTDENPWSDVTDESHLTSRRGSGVAVRVAGGSAEMPYLEQGKEVFLKNFKVNADKEQLYGDLADLSDLCLGSENSREGALYPVAVSQTITWQRR